MSSNIVWSYCGSCNKETKHGVIASKKIVSEDYDVIFYEEIFQIVECNGCEYISFRKKNIDHMNTEENENGEDIPSVTESTYPGVLSHHAALKDVHYLPEKIQLVYEQTILALKGESKLLAAVGFRAVIEAICLAESIKGSNLEQKINNLAKNRLISDKEAERLHSIRFLGNDSVHEIEMPSDHKLYLVLGIVEHLLQNLYIIDNQASGILDTIITDYNDFERLLIRCIDPIQINEERTLQQILGKHQRRISSEILAKLETVLTRKVSSGDFKFLNMVSESAEEAAPLSVKFRVVEKFDWDDLPF